MGFRSSFSFPVFTLNYVTTLDFWCDYSYKSQEIILVLLLTVYCFDESAILDGILNFTYIQVVDYSWLDEDIVDQDSDTSCRNPKSYFTFADKQN